MTWNDVKAEPSGGFNLVMALLDGSWGAGKSFTSLAVAMHGAELLGATVGVIDSENRMGPYEADYPRCADSEKYKRIVTTSPLDAIRFIETLATVDGPKILIEDSLSLFWPAAQELRLKEVQRVKPNRENLAINDWGPIKKWYNGLIDLPNQMGIHLLSTGRQEDEYEDQDGERIKVGVKVSGEKQTGYRFYTHLTMRPEQMRDKMGVKVQTGKVICQVTKDNWHQKDTHIGEHWVNPTGKDLAWLWTRLQGGATAVPSMTKAAVTGAADVAAEKPVGPEVAGSYGKRWMTGWKLSEATVLAKKAELGFGKQKVEALNMNQVLSLDAALAREVEVGATV